MRILALLLVLVPALAGAFPRPAIPFEPETYVCYQAIEPLVLDGRLDEESWRKAMPTATFVDIEGELKPRPRLFTRARMLWDEEYFYVGAFMQEPHLWATYRERDSVIYHENDFEIFIDPDGDNHEYYELEINALGTEWDLLLVRPYRDGGPAVHAWDIPGLRCVVDLQGTINDPSDTDRGWSVEIAIPWKALAECAHRPSPPEPGDQWRVNFSRVQWDLRSEDGAYVKETGEDGRPLPEHNWVWSPQGLIAMHYPEMWGVVQFSRFYSGEEREAFREDPALEARFRLCEYYYAQREFREAQGRWAADLKELGAGYDAQMQVLPDRFLVRLPDAAGQWHSIDETGRLARDAAER